MANSMTFRNISSTPITIKHYEVQEDTRTKSGRLANITSLWSTPAEAGPPTSSLGDVSLPLDPFQTCQADIQPAKAPNQSLSIVLEIQNEIYQANMLQITPGPQTLLSLTHNSQSKHGVIYNAKHHHVTLLPLSTSASWMQKIQDEVQISALSIPGTHNSPTHHRALPSVRCQVASVPEQLKHGVRFLDIRVQPETPQDPSKDGLILVHGVFPISLTGIRHFRRVVDDVLTFLSDNPTETVIMSVKREGPGNATDAQLSRIMRDHYAGDPNRWFTAPRIPTLGEVRGKIVLIRRFALEDSLKNEWGGAGWCINADTWADNTPNAMCPSGDICIQDFYEVLESENIEKKIQYSIDHLKRAAKCKTLESEMKQPFYVNFLTASNFWKQSCWPDKIATKLNPAIVEFLCMKHNLPGDECGEGDGSTGIVVCDWVGHEGDWSIVACILAYNAKFTNREIME